MRSSIKRRCKRRAVRRVNARYSKLFPNIEQVPGKTANECGYFSRTAAVAIARAQLRAHTPSVIRSLELRETIERRVLSTTRQIPRISPPRGQMPPTKEDLPRADGITLLGE